MTVPFYTSVREYRSRKEEFDKAISAVLEKGDFILGSSEKELEREIASYSKARYGAGVANGSDALVLCCDALGYKDGAEVITPTFTFFASASCIARLGGAPIFCDIDEDTFCMDVEDAATRITKNTKGLLPVHLFCQMADMNKVLKLARDNNLSVLEDAAEAFGMKQDVGGEIKTAGTIGDAGVYSFFPTKTLGGYGDGGMVVTNREDVYTAVKTLRVHGASQKYRHDLLGYNSRLDTLQASILQVKLQKIDDGIALRKKYADQYRTLLGDIEEITLPVVKDGNVPVYYVFQLKAEDRDNLAVYLKEKEIGASVYYPTPLHLQKCFDYLGYKKGDFPISEKLCGQVLALPIFPEITEDEVSYVCETIKEFYKR